MSAMLPLRLLSGCALAVCLPALAAMAGSVTQTNIVANKAIYHATVTDPTLLNAWGISTPPNGPFWISSNGNGTSPIYSAAGAKAFTVTIPPPTGQAGPSTPTGQVFNPTDDFPIGANGAALFLFATEDGTISGWNPSVTNAVLAVDNSKLGAVYKGLALAKGGTKNFLLAANFHSGKVEIYDDKLHKEGGFRSPNLPAKYSPFNVAVLNGNIYIAYAVVDADRHDDAAGPGRGVLDQVTLSATGALTFMRRIQAHGPLNSPWGMAIAPASFKVFSGSLLVGNFGDGRVHAYNVTTGAFMGTLVTAPGTPLAIDGLWALYTGSGDPSKVYFSAGPRHEADGLFGSLGFVPAAAGRAD